MEVGMLPRLVDGIRMVMLTLLVIMAVGAPALAQGLPKASRPEDVGLSSERLKRLTAAFQEDVEKGKIPGAVILIARHGKIGYFVSVGFLDREKQLPMRRDAIFRIASMTKPIVSVAAMTLVEQGKLQLGDPVSVYLPELKNVRVGVERKTEGSDTPELALETPRREMTIQDLFRHTSGLTYGIFGDSLVKRAYREANVTDPKQTLAEMVTKLSQLPLAFHPGTTFEYSMSIDVLGRVIEVVSGMELDRFIADRVTNPTRMADSGFLVSEGQGSRVAEPQVDPATGKRPPMRDVTKPQRFISGGGGMVSTAADYMRFGQLLLNGGQLDGARLLSPKTVAFMTADHLPPGIAMSPTTTQGFGALMPSREQGQGFGLGFAVRKDAGRNVLPGSPGEYYWVGAFGTAFWVDPSEKLVTVMMVQVPLAQGAHYRSLLRNLVYQAVVR
jgi:CubicO group peptidase (beta-lactamase class C family)